MRIVESNQVANANWSKSRELHFVILAVRETQAGSEHERYLWRQMLEFTEGNVMVAGA
jgi:hypothetical protein